MATQITIASSMFGAKTLEFDSNPTVAQAIEKLYGGRRNTSEVSATVNGSALEPSQYDSFVLDETMRVTFSKPQRNGSGTVTLVTALHGTHPSVPLRAGDTIPDVVRRALPHADLDLNRFAVMVGSNTLTSDQARAWQPTAGQRILINRNQRNG